MQQAHGQHGSAYIKQLNEGLSAQPEAIETLNKNPGEGTAIQHMLTAERPLR
jgi:hypothetical protein